MAGRHSIGLWWCVRSLLLNAPLPSPLLSVPLMQVLHILELFNGSRVTSCKAIMLQYKQKKTPQLIEAAQPFKLLNKQEQIELVAMHWGGVLLMITP